MKFVDMFCGVGTIRMGFEQAGHECVYSIEWDKHKRRIYNVIFGSDPEGQDIRRVQATDIPQSDVWCFGAPCQDFSIAGKREGLEGDRSSLVREVFRLIRETKEEYRPEWILYENVKGMLSSNKGFDYFEILFEMDSLGYGIQWQLLNSKDFGVPQNRERVFTLGHLRTRGRREVFPIGRTDKKTGANINILAHRKGFRRNTQVYNPSGSIEALDTCQGGGREPHVIIKGQVSNEGSQAGKVYGTEGIFPAMCAGTHGYAMGNIEVQAVLTPNREEKRQNGRRFKEPGEPMFTLTKQDIHGVAYQNRIRRLTPRECWRLQGMPDYITDKVIAAGISDTQMYRGAGDACTVNVIYEIARRL